MLLRNTFAIVMLSFAAAAAAVADPADSQWPRFRGPNGRGESEEQGFPTQWDSNSYQWEVELPGIGHSSPVIWGDRLFIQSALPQDGTQVVLCLEAPTGRLLWKKQYPSDTYHTHLFNSFASSTPAVDQQRVYVSWGTPDQITLMALDHDGNPQWRRALGPFVSQHGFAASPIVHRGRVILANQQRDDELTGESRPVKWTSEIVCVEAETGETIWSEPRLSSVASYSVPCIRVAEDGSEELVCCSTAHGIYALDLETGRPRWSYQDAFTMRTVSSPLVVGTTVFGSTGSGQGGNYVLAIRLGSPPEFAYKVDRQAPYVPTPVAKGNLVFLWSDKGFASCIEADSGQRLWFRRVEGDYFGSPIRVADAVYCISDRGEVVVLAAEREFEELGRVMLGDESRSTPAVAGGRMFLRTYSRLFCLGSSGDTPATRPAGDLSLRISDSAENVAE